MSSKSHASGRYCRALTLADAMASEQAEWATDSEQDQIRFSNRIYHLAGLGHGWQPGGRPATIVLQAGRYADESFKFFDGKCANALFHVGFNKGADAALCVYSALPADVDRCVRPAGLR
jgi:hypothetical protein